MTFDLLRELSESKMYPTVKKLDHESFDDLSEAAYLNCIALRILLCESSTEQFAVRYLQRTAKHNGFSHWHTDGTDLYIALHALTEKHYGDTMQHNVDALSFTRWFRALKVDPCEIKETRRLFLKLDFLLHIRESSLKAVRRLATDWPTLDHKEQQLVMTRLLQMMRARTPRSELLPHLVHAARAERLELDDVCNAENGENCEADEPALKQIDIGKNKPKKPKQGSFLASLAGLAAGYGTARAVLGPSKLKETATAGATSAANIATGVAVAKGGIGVGFDPNGHKGIYQGSKRKPAKRSGVRRRPT